MKMRDAIPFYRILSVFCFVLTTLLVVRRIIVIELTPLNILLAFIWPVVGLYIAIQFINHDGYTTGAPEVLFYLFILYCSIYFLIDTSVIITQGLLGSEIITLNIVISILGWSGILAFIFL